MLEGYSKRPIHEVIRDIKNSPGKLLVFNDVSLVDDILCSVVAFDSGESSFNMIMQPMPNIEIKTVGSSHYKGDLFIDMETNWVQKVVMDEIVVSETIMPMPPHKINSVIERMSTIRSVNESVFSPNEKD